MNKLRKKWSQRKVIWFHCKLFKHIKPIILIIGYKTINIEGKIIVNFAWCKLCAKRKNTIYNNPKCKGNAKKSAEVYIRGINNITKWSIDRHLGNIKNYLDSQKFE